MAVTLCFKLTVFLH